MSGRESHQGYALLLLLVGVGAMSTSFSLLWGWHQAGHWRLWQLEAMQLNDERRRLLYYSADYAVLYEPGGAGPGHLPCPDTDIQNTRPGPNPPCGRALIAAGLLPDGVSRSIGRVAFSASLNNRSGYAVFNRIVNNPSQGISTGQWPDGYAFDSHNSGYARISSASGQSRVVTQADLAEVTTLWVKAWYVTKLMSSKLGGCTRVSAFENESLIKIDELQPPNASLRLMAWCHSSVIDTALGALTAADSGHCIKSEPTCTLYGEALINWWVDALDWEGVPLIRHWFVANGWHRSTEFVWDQQCLNEGVKCALWLNPNHDRLRLDLKLHADEVNSPEQGS